MAPESTPAGSALVTGASRGIGAESTASAISDAGGTATAIQADVTDVEAIDGLFSALEESHGPVMVLVNNAGTRADALSPMIDDESWDRVIETNLSAAFRTTRRALRPMIRARFGRVINVASIVGPQANPGQANYAASKAGLIGLTKTVASEVAKRSVTVNAIAPGFVETELTEGILGPELLERIPAGRPGTTEEVAACARFLASPGAAYVTGVTLTVDGGMTA